MLVVFQVLVHFLNDLLRLFEHERVRGGGDYGAICNVIGAHSAAFPVLDGLKEVKCSLSVIVYGESIDDRVPGRSIDDLRMMAHDVVPERERLV